MRRTSASIDVVFGRPKALVGGMAILNRMAAKPARAVLECCAFLIAASATDRAPADPPTVAIASEQGEPSIAAWIAAGSNLEGLRALLDAGRDPLRPDRDGDTAVHAAAMARDPAYLELLLARGLSPNVRNARSQRTPIMSAMLADRDRQFAMLIAAGADLALADAMGNTPLHVAAQINQPHYVLALLRAGGPPAALNAQGQTFQRYLFMAPGHLLTEENWRSRRAVADWLRRSGIVLEVPTP
jgi:hypothetical protein